MADPARAARMAQRIKVVVAQALGKIIKDPRVENITITDARVTNDLQHATLYYTVFGDEEDKAAGAEALNSARGAIRKEVGRNLTARLTPTVEFVADEIPVNASHLEDVLRAARAKDAEVAALAAKAQYAGEADPYRKPNEVDELEDLEDDLDAADADDLDDADVDDADVDSEEVDVDSDSEKDADKN